MKLFICLLFVSTTQSQTAEPSASLYGVGYNAKHTNGECPSLDKVVNDLKLLKKISTRIRTFGLFDCDQGQLIMQAAHTTNTKVSLGMFINNHDMEFERELQKLKYIVQNFRHTIPMIEHIIVGSESYYRNETSFLKIAEYINKTKSYLNSQGLNIPLTTAEVKDSWYPSALVDAVDVMFVNAYPYWEGVPIEKAVDHLFNKIYEVKLRVPNKPFILGETGWPENGYTFGSSVPSKSNQILFFTQFICRAKRENIAYYWFSAFDEAWKGTEAKFNWGVFNSEYKLKPGFPNPLDSC